MSGSPTGARSAPSVNEIARELKEKGALCLPAFFDARVAEAMRAEARTLLTEQVNGVRSFDPQPAGQVMWVIPEVFEDPRFRHLGEALNSAYFREIAARCYPKSRFFRNAMITHDYKPCKITDVHFDFTPTFKFMIYLTDVDKDSAAFRYCFGSHRRNRRLRIRYLLSGRKLRHIPNIPGPTEHVELTDLEGPAGTLILFDTDGFHSAGSLKEGKERLLIRATTVRNEWYHNDAVGKAARRNPLRFLVPLMIPKGRDATRGSTRATMHPDS